jgi:hypothetical protein
LWVKGLVVVKRIPHPCTDLPTLVTSSLDNNTMQAQVLCATVVNSHSIHKMAPPLAESQHVRMRHMSTSKVCFTANEIAKVADCSSRTVYGSRARARAIQKASSKPVGRPRSITPRILDALCEYLREQPTLIVEDGNIRKRPLQPRTCSTIWYGCFKSFSVSLMSLPILSLRGHLHETRNLYVGSSTIV